MKALQLLILFIVIVLSFTTCKRYPEGGWSNVSIRHLFGKNLSRNIKYWELNKYEVNGIDSTEFTNLNNSKVMFRIGNSRQAEYYVSFIPSLYEYQLEFTGNKHKNMFFKNSFKGPATYINQYFTTGFYRNIFNPSCSISKFSWEVVKLTKSELIVKANNYGVGYKITLSATTL